MRQLSLLTYWYIEQGNELESGDDDDDDDDDGVLMEEWKETITSWLLAHSW